MRSVRTTSIDLGSADVVADPYPHLAAERTQHEASGIWLTFLHGAASAALRDRGLGRIRREKEPAAYLFGNGLVESPTALFDRFPEPDLMGEPESRGTFVLRGFRRVPCVGRAASAASGPSRPGGGTDGSA